MSYGTLYLIPTTLGEGGSVAAALTPEALALAARLDAWVVENAKSARAFLAAVGAVTPLARPMRDIAMSTLDVATPDAQLPALLAPLLAGQDMGLVSEAGCPAVADPGARLVRLAHEHGIRVHPVIGPSSPLLALMASGLNGQSFAFNGYLPTEAGARAARIGELEAHSRKERQTQLFIETPYRNAALFDALVQRLSPDTLLCVAIDLSLPGEMVQTRSVRAWRKTPAPEMRKRPAVFLFLA